jgi:hypothetical protein
MPILIPLAYIFRRDFLFVVTLRKPACETQNTTPTHKHKITKPPHHQSHKTQSSTLLLPPKRKDDEDNNWEETLLEGCLPLFRLGIDSSGVDPR